MFFKWVEIIINDKSRGIKNLQISGVATRLVAGVGTSTPNAPPQKFDANPTTETGANGETPSVLILGISI